MPEPSLTKPEPYPHIQGRTALLQGELPTFEGEAVSKDPTARRELPLLNPGNKVDVLGVLVNATDYDRATEAIIRAAQVQRPYAVSALAVHGVMTGVLDPVHRFRLNHLDLVTPDGQPVRWAMNLLHGAGLKDRVYGPTLTLNVCERAALEGLPIFLYGAKRKTLARLIRNLENWYPGIKIAGSRPSLFRRMTEEERWEIARDIRESGARILLLGLGCPRQEVWVYEMRKFLPMPMLAVGAAFDFHSGMAPQAPAWMQKSGLEWLFRLRHNPLRLWQRYLLLNPLYAGLIFLRRFGIMPKMARRDNAIPPKDEVRYG
jgi:N-acetylglucosaminyldiphosphoundecaprenol N-acetyl-beta-D-mannosaminyltransferase